MTTSMGSGGVEKALINFLEVFPRERYTITLLLVKKEGAFLSYLPKDVNCVELRLKGIQTEEILYYQSFKRVVYNNVRKLRFWTALKICWRKATSEDWFYYLPKKVSGLESLNPFLKQHYDVAICYHIHQAINLAYIAECINADYKIAWVHNDFKNTGFNIRALKSYLMKYDKYFVVSDELLKEFKELMPAELINKVDIFQNIISGSAIKRQAEEFYPSEYDKNKKLRIVSVGRLNEQKGFDIAIDVCKILAVQYPDLVWYIVGEGEERVSLQEKIDCLGLTKNMKLLGNRTNPYPYIKNALLYVQPSRHEGYGIAVAEARALSKPIICTPFAGAFEQIINNKTGMIVPLKVESLAEAIQKCITDSKFREYLEENLKNEFPQRFTNSTDMHKLLECINKAKNDCTT